MNKSFVEEARDSIIKNEKPIHEVVPGSPFLVVTLSYLAVLALSLLVFALANWIAA